MAGNVIDLALFELKGKELQSIESLEVTENDGGAEVVKTMRRSRRGIGVRRGVPDFELSITAKKLIPSEVDWRGLRDSGEYFPVTYQEMAGGLTGDRFNCRDCRVIEVGNSYNADGEASETIRIVALDHKKEV